MTEPVLVVGIGGAGSKLAHKAKELLDSDCLLISNDKQDLNSDCTTIQIPSDSLVNPSAHLIRGLSFQVNEEIEAQISKYSTIIIMANLAGRAGTAMAPTVSSICKKNNKNSISFAIMPFKFEKDRIFRSGISLKRLRENSDCTVVLDNDALLDSNPDLSPEACYKIANQAIEHIVNSVKTSTIPRDTSILSTGKDDKDIETSLKESIKMLYEDAPPNSVKRSMLYVLGGNKVPVGMLNTITNIASGIFNEDSTNVSMSITDSEQSNVMMLSTVQGQTRFDKYDPLGVIPKENMLDWDEPECSINCKLELDQLE